jgi:hypothetical protein
MSEQTVAVEGLEFVDGTSYIEDAHRVVAEALNTINKMQNKSAESKGE